MKIEDYILKCGTEAEKAELLSSEFTTASPKTIQIFIWFTKELSNIENYAFCYGGAIISNLEPPYSNQHFAGFEGIIMPDIPPGSIVFSDLINMYDCLNKENVENL